MTRITLILIVALSALNVQAQGPTPKPLLGGVIELTGGSMPFCDQIATSASLNKPFIDGFRGRIGWDAVQTGSATYDWDCIDRALATCAANGKWLSLSVAMGTETPSWVYDTAPTVPRFPCDNDGNGTNESNMPWSGDTNYLAKAKTFIAAFGARYDGHPNLRLVFLVGQGQQHVEYHVTAPPGGENFVRWRAEALAHGYDDTGGLNAEDKALRFATTEIINAFILAFPNTAVLATGGNPWNGGQAGSDTEDFMYAQMADARHGRCTSTLKATLTHTNAPDLRLYPYGRQAIFSSSDHSRFYSPSIPDRVYTDAVFNNTTTITSQDANFDTLRDAGHSITGTGIPTNATIVTVVSESTITISAATTTSGTLKTINVIDQPGNPTATQDLLKNGYDNGCQYVEVYGVDVDASVNDAVFVVEGPRLKSNIPTVEDQGTGEGKTPQSARKALLIN